jgi:PAS domain S-box-containing protein
VVDALPNLPWQMCEEIMAALIFILSAWIAILILALTVWQSIRLIFVPAGGYIPWRRGWMGLMIAAVVLGILFTRNALILSGFHAENHPSIRLLLSVPVRTALTNLAALGLLACATECYRIFRFRYQRQTVPTPAAQVVMNYKGLVQEWNDTATRLLGWNAEEVIGQEMADFLIPDDLMVEYRGEKISAREAHRAGLDHFRRTSEAPFLDMLYPTFALHKDGRHLPVTVQISGHLTSSGMRFLGWILPRVP